MRIFCLTVYGRNGAKSSRELTEQELNKLDELTGVTEAKASQDLFGHRMPYYGIRDLAWITLLKSGITALPVDLHKILAHNGITILGYIQHAQAVEYIDQDNLRQNSIAICARVSDRNIICYNESTPKPQLRFGIAHELGHLLLRHGKYQVRDFEQEANMFAARLLMPMGVLKELGATTPDKISKLCDTSIMASAFRAERLRMLLTRNKFFTSELEIQLLAQMNDFIQQNTHHSQEW